MAKRLECPDCYQTFALMYDFLDHECLKDWTFHVKKRKPKNGKGNNHFYEDD